MEQQAPRHHPSQFAGTNQATAVNITVEDVEFSVRRPLAEPASAHRP
jgi:hypothetical protein